MILNSALLCITFVAVGTEAWKNDPNCGIKGSQESASWRIIGGHNASRHEYPWMVYLEGWNASCGATIVSQNWILTAAHCVLNDTDNVIDTKYVSLTFGYYDQSEKNESLVMRRHPDAIFYYDKYNGTTNDGDVALLKLNKSLPFDDPVVKLSAICLPENKEALDDHVNETATVTGWGDVDNNFQTPEFLQAVNLTVISQSSCVESYKNKAPKNMPPITDNMLCVDTAGKDSCRGDSGGPLALFNATKQRWYQYGVVSWGYHPCATAGLEQVSARVTELLSWITDTIDSN